jgi:hypothetical protein
MKKIIFPLVIVSLFFLSAGNDPVRFATPEEMAKAVLATLQKNDSARFLLLYPTQQETNTAFVDPWKDSSLYDHQKMWAGKFYLNNSELTRSMFRDARQAISSEGVDWSTVQFVSVQLTKESKRSPGIDYLYRAEISCSSSADRNVTIRLTDIMKTNAGYNCGLGIKARVGPRRDDEAVERMRADSMRMSDSISAVIMMMQAKMMADSTAMADSMARTHHNKKPH